MNIVEAYIKFNKQLIIIISGLSGSRKTELSSNISKDFKIKQINIETYCIEKNDRIIELSNKVSVSDWDDVDTYDWDTINERVNKYKSEGVVISGPYFPSNKLDFQPDFHIHIKVPKQMIIETRRKYIQENPEKCKELVKHINTPIELLMINKITYPHYLDYLKLSKIDKYLNVEELDIDKMYDQIIDFLFDVIQKFLDKYNKLNIYDNTKLLSKENEDNDVIYLGTTYNN